MLLNITNVPVEVLQHPLFIQRKVQVSVLRLDKIHPVISGNKLFKLHYFLKEVLQKPEKTIITFGGAYSNHLAATAYACNKLGLKSIGIVRGEEPATLSHTLKHCRQYGMQLNFVSRQQYAKNDVINLLSLLNQKVDDCIVIPEGGYSTTGAKGAALITELFPKNIYTHICTASGTATTTAGLLMADGNENVICVPVLKGVTDMEQRILHCTEGNVDTNRLQVFSGYHFNGYAKTSPQLFSFINNLWQQHQLPTDFVYTSKMMYAVFDKIKEGFFAGGSNILCLHTGGLQGNLSLPKETLLF